MAELTDQIQQKSGRLQAKSPANAGFLISFYSSSALKFV
jgi:preprotein translocase subunit Sec61beta